jgi:hypothetical protein
VRCDVAEDPFGRRRRAVFYPDRELAIVPGLSDLAERGSDDLFDEIGDRTAFADDGPGEIARRRLVAGDERRVHLRGGGTQPLRTRCRGVAAALGRRLRSMNSARSSGSIQ